MDVLKYIVMVLTFEAMFELSECFRDRRAATSRCPKFTGFNGRVKYKRRGNRAAFRCARGEDRYGKRFLNCRRDGTWDGEMPVCIKSGCVPVDVSQSPYLDVTEEYRGALLKFSCEQDYQLLGAAESYCSGGVWSSPMPRCMATSDMTECDFERDLCGWSQDDTEEGDWTRHAGATSTGGTGPKFDHTHMDQATGHYMFFESSNPTMEGDKARLVSPEYPAYMSPMCFDFWYHILGPDDPGHVGSLEVFVRGKSQFIDDIEPVFKKEGNQGDVWTRGELIVDEMQESYQIVIEATRMKSYISDIAIDDLRLFNCSEPDTSTAPPPVTTTQTPTPTATAAPSTTARTIAPTTPTVQPTTTTTTVTTPSTPAATKATPTTSTAKPTTQTVVTKIQTKGTSKMTPRPSSLIPSTKPTQKAKTTTTPTSTTKAPTKKKTPSTKLPTTASTTTLKPVITTVKPPPTTTTTTTKATTTTTIPSTAAPTTTTTTVTTTTSTPRPTTSTTSTTPQPPTTQRPTTTTTTTKRPTTMRPTTRQTPTTRPSTTSTSKPKRTTVATKRTARPTPVTPKPTKRQTTRRVTKPTTTTVATTKAPPPSTTTPPATTTTTQSTRKSSTPVTPPPSSAQTTMKPKTSVKTAATTTEPPQTPVPSTVSTSTQSSKQQTTSTPESTSQKTNATEPKGSPVSSHPKDGTLMPLMIGLGVGIVAGLIIIGVIGYVCHRRRKFYTSRYEDELKPITNAGSQQSINNVQYYNDEEYDN